MIAELQKALRARKHPGVGSHLTLPRLAWQAVPFVTSPAGRARPPLSLYWSVNSVCNLHCKMCDIGMANRETNFFKNLGIEGKLEEIPIELYKRVTDEVAPYGPMIALTSTEPLMYKPLAEAIGYTRAQGLDIAVTTGGYTLPKRAEELAEAGLSQLNVSLDGAPDVHDAIRGRRDSFERAATGLTLFKEAAQRRGFIPEILVNCTITNLNYHALEAYYDALAPYPIDQINFTFMCFVTEEMASVHNARWGDKYRATVNCVTEETRPDGVDVGVLAEQIRAVRARSDARVVFLPDFGADDLRTFFHEPRQFMGQGRCMVNWFIGQIIANGDVIPYTRCYYVPLGNIHQEAFLDVWNGDRARAWRRDLRKHRRFPACTRCDQVY